MEISVLHNNFLTYVVEPFSYPKNYKKTKQSHFATTSRPVEGFSHEDSCCLIIVYSRGEVEGEVLDGDSKRRRKAGIEDERA